MRSLISFVFAFTGIITLLNGAHAGAGDKRVRGNGGQAYGCVTADTMITLADGQAIQMISLTSKNQVLNQDSQKVQVLYTLAGLEKLPMFLIETESGKTIKATKGHPFYSKSGFTAAKDLVINSEVLTIDGFEIVTKVSTFSYDGHVYNLAVADINEASDENIERKNPFLGLTAKEHSVILNGFVTGDVIIQRLLAQSEK